MFNVVNYYWHYKCLCNVIWYVYCHDLTMPLSVKLLMTLPDGLWIRLDHHQHVCANSHHFQIQEVYIKDFWQQI